MANDEFVKPETDDDRSIKLSKPITWEDKTYQELFINKDTLMSLSADDIIDAEKEFIAEGGRAYFKETSKLYQAIIAAKAANVPIHVIQRTTGKEFTDITIMVQNFLLS